MKLHKLHGLLLAAAISMMPSAVYAIGAIAVDDEVGEEEPGYGYSTGYDNRKAAEARALKECKAHGNTHCKVVVWFESCGAYAVSHHYYGYGWGKTKAIAEAAARKMCGNSSCEVKISGCE